MLDSKPHWNKNEPNADSPAKSDLDTDPNELKISYPDFKTIINLINSSIEEQPWNIKIYNDLFLLTPTLGGLRQAVRISSLSLHW